MKTIVVEYFVALVVFLAIDAVWLSTIAKSFYVAEIGGLMRESPNFAVAFAFYLLFVAGLVYFVIHPATGVLNAAMAGAFFGLVAYATYDLTNLAVMKGFTVRVAVVDMIWGAVLAASVCAVTVWFVRRFLPA